MYNILVKYKLKLYNVDCIIIDQDIYKVPTLISWDIITQVSIFVKVTIIKYLNFNFIKAFFSYSSKINSMRNLEKEFELKNQLNIFISMCLINVKIID